MPATSRSTHTEESAEVEVLVANMEKLRVLTKKIAGSLNKLDASGKTVQTSVRPIYGNTGSLQSANTNIDNVRHALGKIRADMDKRKKEAPIIRSGLKKSTLLEYTSAMVRTRKTLDDLKKSDLKSNQTAIGELQDLLRYGEGELDGRFRDAITQESTPVQPLHHISKGVPFPAITPQNLPILRTINSTILSGSGSQKSPSGSRSESIYADIRGSYVASTLRTLASASVSTARRPDPNVIYRQGDCGIGSYCKAIEEIFSAEHGNVTAVFQPSQHTRLHAHVVKPALSEFSNTLGDLNKHIQAHILTDCFLGYEIIDLVSRLSTRVDSKNHSLKVPINDALQPIRSTSKASISMLRSDIEVRINGLTSLPADSSPVQVTYDVMTRSLTMTEYLTPLGGILATTNAAGSTGTDPSTFDVGADSETLFATFLGSMLETLLIALDSKSRMMLKTRAAQGIFMGNNIAVIDRQLQSQPFVLIPLDVPRAKIAPFRKKGAKAYVDTWADLARNLQDQLHTGSGVKGGPGRPPSGNPQDSAAYVKSLSGKEKDGIKERFKSFNTGLEELVQRHKGFRLEPEVRQEVQREVTDFLAPLYERFYERYKEIDKGKGKVVKYDRGQLSVLLAGL